MSKPETITIKNEVISTDVEELDLSSKELSSIDIEPLKYCKNLNVLNLCLNKIDDITPLAELSQLKELNLYGNKISDITPLAGLIQLIWINLCSNPISDITPLAGLRKLRKAILCCLMVCTDEITEGLKEMQCGFCDKYSIPKPDTKALITFRPMMYICEKCFIERGMTIDRFHGAEYYISDDGWIRLRKRQDLANS